MGDVGHNPACIIPAWRDFVAAAARPAARRRRADLARPQPRRAGRVPVPRGAAQPRLRRHRRLPPRLPLRRRAPRPRRDRGGRALAPLGRRRRSARYRGDRRPAAAALRAAPRRARPAGRARDHVGDAQRHPRARRRARARRPASASSAPATSCSPTHEVATNSIRHGGGEGTLRVWHEDDMVVCEVRDRGRLDQPLAGRARPELEARRRLGPVAGQPALRPRPDPHAARRQRRAAAPR